MKQYGILCNIRLLRMKFNFSFIHFLIFIVVPVCFILTYNRRHETYESIFRYLKRIRLKVGLDLKPLTIICDFEQAFMNAAAKVVYVFVLFHLSDLKLCPLLRI